VKRFSLLFFLFFFPKPALSFWGEIPVHLGNDLQELFSTPSVAIAFATTGASLSAHEYADQSWMVSTPKKYFGSSSKWISDGGLALSFASPVISYFVPNRGKHVSEVILESLFFTTIVTTSTKFIVNRTRPNGVDNKSFPSGHSAYAFSAATALAYETPWYVGIPSLLLAGTVAFTRIDLRVHFVSDVFAGAGIGALFSTAVHLAHQKPEIRDLLTHFSPAIEPNGINLVYTQRF